MPEERPFYEAILDYAVFAPIGLLVEVVEDLPKLSEKGRQRVEQQVTLARLVGRLALGQVQRKFDRGEGGSHAGEAVEVPATARPASRPPAGQATETMSSSTRPPRSAGSAGPAGASRPSRPAGPSARPPARSGPAQRPAQRPATAGVPSSDGAAATFPPDRAPQTRSTDGIAAAVRDELGAEEPQASPVEPPAGSAAPGAPAADLPSAESLAIPGYDTLAASQVVQRLSSLEPDELEAIRRYEVSTRGRRTILHRIAQLSAGGGRATA